ncbi:sigma-54 dependent transcriptional regulator [Chelatococcus sp. XZ-Ab1]|uniref:sigma-54-dependent transcriptional regulator n=1 Tax=Chelatococcus sp. XZ-Ab1 TaxID=3034027 RepID=UPI0023E3D09F|nr:sigma-54 dependent transcriptional regulator [Chelatococcus sp. XZ-Ab1]
MSLEPVTIALVEDDPIMGESLVQRLSLEGLTVRWWQRGREAVSALREARVRAVVCDIRLPDIDGETLFREIARRPDAPPFLFITGFGDIDQAVRLMRAGAANYVTKPFDLEDFLVRLAELVRPTPGDDTPVLGVSQAMGEVERLLSRLARVAAPVLICGETGTGKDVAARFLHARSEAAAKPFVAVNCAAIPADLMESELFGHEKGAFTGAIQRHVGYAERTAGGVLFLDEIGELRPELQAKLLRLIEERSFHRVGGERPVAFDGRILAATNADLPALVEAGRFRQDLYYRINVVTVRMPALRDRPDDIPWLMNRFFTEFAERHETSVKGISALTEEAARAHAWPGNIRELRNRMERAMALALGAWLMPGDLFPDLAEYGGPGLSGFGSLEDARLEAERRHIVRALAATGGEIAAAARLLGIGRTTLWEKMRRLGIAVQ